MSEKRTLGVAIIGSGLMAKAHTMAWRNLQAVYGKLPVDIRLVVLAEATDELAQAGEEAEVKTMVGFSYLRNPGLALAKKLVEDGEIGEPVSFTSTFAIDAMTDPQTPFTWRQDRALAGTGALGDVGAHAISFARYLVGPIDRVASLSKISVPRRPVPSGNFGYGEKAAEGAPTREVENDDVTIFLTAFANGAIGTIEASRVSSGRAYDVGFTLTGTKGAIRFDQQRMFELQVRLASDPAGTSGFRHIQLGPGNGDYGTLWPVPGINLSIHDLKFFEAHDLIQAIVTDSPAYPDFREGWEIEKILAAVDEAGQGQDWVKIP